MLSNSTKVWFFILLTSLAFLMLGYELGGRLGLLVGFLTSVSLSFFVFFYGESPILKFLKAQPVRGQDPWGLRDNVIKYADHLGVPYPSIYVIPTKTQTAFCMNHSWQHGSIVFSKGLLDKFSKEDLEAIVSAQICYLKSMDSFWFGVTNNLANALLGLGKILDYFWPPNYFLLTPQKQKPFLKMFSPLSWAMIKLASAHQTFFDNDLLAAELIHDRFRLAEILWRLDGLAQSEPLNVPPCSNHLFIVAPDRPSDHHWLLKSHPPIQIRLQKLMGYYPI